MKIAVFFPGIGYHCAKPLLYYARKLAQECGYENIVLLDYSYEGGNIRGNEEKMQQAFERLYEQAERKLKKIDFSAYNDIFFVSKSVGTIIASAYAKKYQIDCKQMSQEKAEAYLTEKGMMDRVIRLEESTATVTQAADALGVEPEMIIKTMSFLQNDPVR